MPSAGPKRATTSRALIRQALSRLSIASSSDAKSSDGRRPVKVGATAENQNMTAAGATDFDIATLRARRTNKWHKFPPDVLPAWVADMDFGVASSITAALTRLTRNQEYGYAAREGVLAEAFVRRMERRFVWHTDPADI